MCEVYSFVSFFFIFGIWRQISYLVDIFYGFFKSSKLFVLIPYYSVECICVFSLLVISTAC